MAMRQLIRHLGARAANWAHRATQRAMPFFARNMRHQMMGRYAERVQDARLRRFDGQMGHRMQRPLFTDREMNIRREELMGELMRIFPPNFEKINRERLNPQSKEIYDLHGIFLQAVEKGEITSWTQFKGYLKGWLQERRQNPAYAETAFKKFVRSFRREKLEDLKAVTRKFELLSEGIDPKGGNEQAFPA